MESLKQTGAQIFLSAIRGLISFILTIGVLPIISIMFSYIIYFWKLRIKKLEMSSRSQLLVFWKYFSTATKASQGMIPETTGGLHHLSMLLFHIDNMSIT